MGANDRTAKRSPLKDTGSIVKHVNAGATVAFTGSRNGMGGRQRDVVMELLDVLRANGRIQDFHVAVWQGADMDARNEARARGFTVQRHPQEVGAITWLQRGWLLIAAPESGKPDGSGTWANIAEAHRLRMTIVVVAPDGAAVLWKHEARDTYGPHDPGIDDAVEATKALRPPKYH